MTKKLHTKVKIFFPDPYVVRLDYPDTTLEKAETEHRALVRHIYKNFSGTWGHTNLAYEMHQTKNDHKHPAPPGPTHYAGMSPGAVLSSLFDSDWVQMIRTYFVFKDEMDATQFRLSIDTKAIRVHMWPSDRLFTIHEVTDEP